jgi:purine-binding chemotaxis protein CheW
VIDFYGTVVPVLNLRCRFAIREIPISPDQIFVLITTKKRKLALVADVAEGIITMEEKGIIPGSKLDARIEATGIYRTEEGVVVIYDPEQFLSGDDAIQLDACKLIID